MTRTSSCSTTTKTSKPNSTKLELKKLKSILPALKQKPTSTPIEIVLETIRYIRQLEDQLLDRFQIDTSLSVTHPSRPSLSDMSTDSSLLHDISNRD